MTKLRGINFKSRYKSRIMQLSIPKNKKIVGRLFVKNGSTFVIPDDSRLNFDILIPPESTHGVRVGFVVVELTQYPTQHTKAIGKVIEVLGSNMGTSMVINIAIRSYNIPYIWPQEVKQQLINLKEEVPDSAKHGRIDLRSMPLVTIDSEDAHDFDDAVYCEKKSNGGWRLWVAIADVSYYIRPHTPLDKEAIRRSTSVYFPSKVIPMLPEILSNGLCSLNPKVDRLCLVCEMNISSKGYLSSYKFYEAVINSHARLTYNNVWQILQGQRASCNYYKSFVKLLNQLHEMYRTLEQARLKRGSISFEIEETKFILNNQYRIERIELVKRNDAHNIIEECMILANIAAARFVEQYKEPVLYRVHDRPSNNHITSLRILLSKLGLTLGGGDKPEPKDYANIISLVNRRPDQGILKTVLLRSMKQAMYDSKNRGHFGLALNSYVHFTSPIRRYPDLIINRAIKYLLGKLNGNVSGRSTLTGGWHSKPKEILNLGKQCSFSERRADEATRNVSDWLKCDFIKNYIGKVFIGIINSVNSFGFFVRLNEIFIDGLVHISSLKNDYYRYDNINQRLIGDYSGKIYQLGDLVKIRVKSVCTDKRKINFLLISKYQKLNDNRKIECKKQQRVNNNYDELQHRYYNNGYFISLKINNTLKLTNNKK